jgi:hypothetical protein
MIKRFAMAFAIAAMSMGFVESANAGPISDVMTVYDPTGAIFLQTVVLEGDPEGIGQFFYVDVPGDPSLFGSFTRFIEADGSVSDAFGVAVDNPNPNFPYSIGFYSDEEAAGLGIGPGAFDVLEPFGPYDITFYLSPDLRDRGYRATFQSDADVPEPTTLALIGLALLSLLGLGTTRRRADA